MGTGPRSGAGLTTSHAPDTDSVDDSLTTKTTDSVFVSNTHPSPRSIIPPENSSKKLRNSHVKGSGKPVGVFIYDMGALGVLKPKKEMFCLIGAKFAEMGYGESSFLPARTSIRA